MFAALKSALGIGKEWPQYTRADVAKHNTRDSLWIVAGDRVFDVTDFVQLHPGGAVAVLKRAGGCADCKSDFKFHSKGAREQWKKFQIGVLSEEELHKPIPKNAAPSADMLAAASVPLHYGKPVPAPADQPQESEVPNASVSMSRTDEHDELINEDDDGGEDCVAEGHCCRGGAPTAACHTCPHAPACMRKKKVAAPAAAAAAVEEPSKSPLRATAGATASSPATKPRSFASW